MTYRYHYNSDVPLRHYRHFLFTWKISNVHSAEALMHDGVFSRPCLMYNNSETTWQLGIVYNPEKESFNFVILRKYLSETKENKGRVFANIQAKVSTPFFDEYPKVTYSVWCTNDKPVRIPIAIPKTDFVKYIEASYNYLTKNNAWKIEVEVSYNEEMHGKYGRDNTDITELYESFRDIGVDLSTYAMSPKFSDETIQYKTLKFPVHKAIIEARCESFFEKHCNMFKQVIFGKKYSEDLWFFFLLFLYSGNIDILVDVGTLPLGLHKFAKKLEMHDLASVTEPDDFHAFTQGSATCRLIHLKIETRKLINSKPLRKPYHVGSFKEDLDILPILSKTTDHNEDVYIGIEIEMIKGDRPFSMVLECSIKTKYDDHHVEKKRSLFTLEPNACVGFTQYRKLSLIREKVRDFDINGFIEFALDISVGKHQLTQRKTKIRNGEKLNIFKKPYVEVNPILYLKMSENLSDNLGTMLTLPNHSDLELQCGDHFRPVHRIILSARSAWFSKKIDQLKDWSTLVIADTSIIDLDHILQEIYTGNFKPSNCGSLHWYELSWKFELPMLKSKCSSIIEESLTVRSCVKPLEVAISFKDDFLINRILLKCSGEIHSIINDSWFTSLLNKGSPVAVLLKDTYEHLPPDT